MVRSKSSSPPAQAVPQIPAPALLSFLKQASLEPSWTPQYLVKALSLNAADSKQVIATLSAFGYIESAGQQNTWRNTEQGNKMSGAKRPRLKRASADQFLSELIDRSKQLHGDDRRLFRVMQVIVFGDYLTDHDPIQDVDVAVELQPKHNPEAERNVLASLKGRSRGINLHRLEAWMQKRSHKVVFSDRTGGS